MRGMRVYHGLRSVSALIGRLLATGKASGVDTVTDFGAAISTGKTSGWCAHFRLGRVAAHNRT